MNKIFIVSSLFVIALVGGTNVYAHENGEPHEHTPVDESATVTTNEPTKPSRIAESAKERVQVVKDRILTQREMIDARKAELRQAAEARQSERKAKLEGQRLAVCQNRETKINELLTRSASRSESNITRIQGYEEKLRAFYTDQSLESESFDVAAADADEAEAGALASLEVFKSQQFSCSTADGETPSAVIRESYDNRRSAVKNYRDSVKEMFKAAKSAFEAKQAVSEVN